MSTISVPKMTVSVVRESDDETGRIGSLTRAPTGRIYAAAANEVLYSDDDGKTFRPTGGSPGSRAIYGIYADRSRVYLVGSHASIRVSDDGGLGWVNLPVAYEGNLYRMQRAPDGALWVTGDRETLLTSTDGVHFAVPAERKDREAQRPFQRYLDVIFEDGSLLVLSSAGRLERLRGKDEEKLSLAAGKPLTRRLVLDDGTWLVFGDGGTAYRSTDAGKTFAHVELPVAADLEDAVVVGKRVFVVGSKATLLCSTDGGKTFAKIPLPFEGHLWSVLAREDGSLLVSGDQGLIAAVVVSESETMTVPALPVANAIAAKEAEEEEDEGEDDEEDEEEASDDDGASEAPVLSLEEASARWKKEGKAFITALNAYVRACYDVGPNKAGKEPQETREDMAGFVLAELARLNAAGEHAKARELFPPAYEPFDYDALGTSIDAVAFLDGTRRLVAARGGVYVVERNRITQIPDLQLFGRSSDEKLWAKVYADRIDVHRDWDGPKVGQIPRQPDSAIEQIILTPEGDAAAVAGGGIFWLHASGAVRQLKRDASYCHVALSPNGRFFAYGTQDTSHVVVDRKTGQEHSFEPMSSYPHFAFFDRDAPRLVFSSCHALYGSGTMVVDVDRLSRGLPDHARALDRRAWVHSGASAGDRLLLGDRSGYVWAKKPGDDAATWYLFLGSTLTSMAVSPDGKKLLVGSFSGSVIELDLEQPEPDATLLTNGPVKETARWVFWRGHEPMIW